MIKNFNLLANTEVKKKALKILEVGLTWVMPKLTPPPIREFQQNHMV